MDDVFKIYIDQLRNGRESKIDEVLSPAFLDIADGDLEFRQEIKLNGVAYLAENELILRWNISAEALMPCLICNQPVSIEIEIRDLYQSVPLDEIRTGVYNFKELLRETILLELPTFAECNQGHCPKRKEYAKYLKETSNEQSRDEGGHRPFADLDWK